MKVCVFGVGAVGTFVAGRLAKGGAEVSAVTRGATLEAIRSQGVRVYAPGYDISAKITATDDPRTLGSQDAVIVAVKSPSLPSVAAAIGPLLGPNTPVLFLINGIQWWYFHAEGNARAGRRLNKLDPGGALWENVRPERALGGVSFCSCDLLKPGVVHIETKAPKLFMGEPDGSISARATALADRLRGDTLEVEVTADIRATIWAKLQMNICSGLLGALGNSPPKDIYTDPAVADAVRRLAAEIGAVAAAVGRATNVDGDDLVAKTISQAHVPSIVQDLRNGRSMEIDAMFDLPAEMARMTGIATPTLDLLVALVKARARTVGAYTG